MEFRTIFPQKFKSIPEAKEFMQLAAKKIENALRAKYESDYIFAVEELSDTAETMGSLAPVDEKNTSLWQSIKLTKGWKTGVNVRLFWPDNDNQMFLEVSGESKLEDQIMAIMLGTPLILGAAWGWLGVKVKLKLLALLIGGAIGAAFGVAAFYLFANPILSLILGHSKNDNVNLAAEVNTYLQNKLHLSSAMGSLTDKVINDTSEVRV